MNVAVTVVSAFNRTGQVFPEKATFGGYLIAHAKIAKNGKHVNIIVNGDGHYFWQDILRKKLAQSYNHEHLWP